MIRTKKLTKIFRTEEIETTALNKVDLHIAKGEMVAVMGPSGCGKSTLLNILGLLDNPTNGEFIFNGNEVAHLSERNRTNLRKGNIGFVFQNFNLIDELTVLSGGQQQRVAIARAVVPKPVLILADEPTGNLDSANGEEVMNLLTELNKDGTTIVMVTHSPSDAEYAHRVIQLFDGHIVTENIRQTF